MPPVVLEIWDVHSYTATRNQKALLEMGGAMSERNDQPENPFAVTTRSAEYYEQ